MPGNSLEEARFDHVSDTGELVFVSGAGKFAVKIDEALERAILEAKQIRSEAQAVSYIPLQRPWSDAVGV